ncbi:MAG: FAD-binding oxidoreductase [Pseudomonadota bacterium]
MTTGAIRRTTEWRSWGRVDRGEHFVATPGYRADVIDAFQSFADASQSTLAVGLGRSYGDSGLNVGNGLINMGGVDRLMAFDDERGVLRAEAGASVWDILEFAVPRGYFLPTTPGTRFVTLGGAIANDVHGKNHHSAGTIGCHIERICLLRSDRGVVEIAADKEPELFAATIAGLGLTGVILWADLKLTRIPSSVVAVETTPFENLNEFYERAKATGDKAEHTVAWVDCLASGDSLGRGLFTAADWDEKAATRKIARPGGLTAPFETPSFLLNRLTIAAFNEFYYRLGRMRAGRTTLAYDKFHYPLDGVREWNRLYGPRGFYQYQSVIPPKDAAEATREMLRAISKEGDGSFLAVLKTFGARRSPGLLSFPMEGTTLALDFPNRGEKTLQLFATLDKIVMDAGGRLYPAKDGRIPPGVFHASYPHAEKFAEHIDPQLSSTFWERVKRT